MDAKPQLFLSSLPLLTDYVTILAQVTTSGPHLLNSACCRALLRKTYNIVSSPAISDKKHVYIVVNKNEVKKKQFSDSVAACNLKLMKVMQLTNYILQYCLDFTIHTYLHPHWTRVDNKYLEGKTCLFQNRWMGCIRAQINVQDKSVIISLKSTQVKLMVARLSTFHIREDIIQRFMKKEIRTINSCDMGDNTCYVLPSFKPALVHSISYEIEKSCPLKDKSDMIAYWLDYHGMLIPSDTDIFVTLSFNFPGAPTMTYPYYCIRKSFPVMKQGTDVDSINSFMTEVNNALKTKLPILQLYFPVNPSFYTVPDKSKDCLVETPTDAFKYTNKTDDQKVSQLDRSIAPKSIIMPLKSVTSISPTKDDLRHTSGTKIKPRFAPYTKPTGMSNSRSVEHTNVSGRTHSTESKIVPTFIYNSVPTAPSKPFQTNTVNQDNIKSAVNKPPLPNQVTNNLAVQQSPYNDAQKRVSPNFNKSVPKSPIVTPHNLSKTIKSPVNQQSQPQVAHTPKASWSTRKSSQTKTITPKQSHTPRSIPSSFDQDDFDDFEIPQYLLNYTAPKPKTNKTPVSTPKQASGTKKHSPTCRTPQSATLKKSKAPPKIIDEEQINAMFRLGQITKVNNQSLAAFLKKRKVKGVSKFKKDQLVSETVKILDALEPLREF